MEKDAVVDNIITKVIKRTWQMIAISSYRNMSFVTCSNIVRAMEILLQMSTVLEFSTFCSHLPTTSLMWENAECCMCEIRWSHNFLASPHSHGPINFNKHIRLNFRSSILLTAPKRCVDIYLKECEDISRNQIL